jgi:prepilin-type N-terminal cleavage/methylation domain-containing protein
MTINTKGFTLTELMAVVVIVAILAAVATGSYRHALERSHMAEAYNVGATVLEAVNRYYYDNRYESTRECPKYSDLDMEIAKSGSCNPASDYCLKTQYFNIKIPASCSADKVVTAERLNGKYSLLFYPDFAPTRSLEKCSYGSNASGQKICESAGYKTCSGGTCSK